MADTSRWIDPLRDQAVQLRRELQEEDGEITQAYFKALALEVGTGLTGRTADRIEARKKSVKAETLRTYTQTLLAVIAKVPHLSTFEERAKALHVEVRSHTDETPATFDSPLEGPSVSGEYLPTVDQSVFLVRDIEARAIAALHSYPESPSILFGPRGSGKTRVLRRLETLLGDEYYIVRLRVRTTPAECKSMYGLLAHMSHFLSQHLGDRESVHRLDHCSEPEFEAKVRSLQARVERPLLFSIDDFDWNFDVKPELCRSLCELIRSWADEVDGAFKHVRFLLTARVHESRHTALVPSPLYPVPTLFEIGPVSAAELERSSSLRRLLGGQMTTDDVLTITGGLPSAVETFCRRLATGAPTNDAVVAVKHHLQVLARTAQSRVGRYDWSGFADTPRTRVRRWQRALRGEVDLHGSEIVRLYELGAVRDWSPPPCTPHPVFIEGKGS